MANDLSIRPYLNALYRNEIELDENDIDFITDLFSVISQDEHKEELIAYTEENPGFKATLEKFLYDYHIKSLWKKANETLEKRRRKPHALVMSDQEFLDMQEKVIPEDAANFTKQNINFLYDTSPGAILRELERQRDNTIMTNPEISGQMKNLLGRKAGTISTQTRLRALATVKASKKRIRNDLEREIERFKEMINMIGLELEKTRAAEQAAEELIAAESSARNKGKKRQKGRRRASKCTAPKPKATTAQQQVAPIAEANAASQSPEQATAQYLAQLQGRVPHYKFAPRVRRWETKNHDDIRAFVDKGGARHYAEIKDDAEILQHRSYHLMPGVEKIFCAPQNLKTYTFPTKTGLGLMVMFKRGEEEVFGMLYFGIDRNLIYHRQFVPLKKQDTARSILEETHGKLPSDRAPQDDWSTTTRFIFHMETEGVIRIEYPTEDYEISVFPIQKELLQTF